MQAAILDTFAQQGATVSGKVADPDGNPLIGVTVQVKGSSVGVISDINGKFSVKGVDAKATLVFSYVGYLKEEVSVKGKTYVNVTLAPDQKQLEEVVVVGYGARKKETLTGAIANTTSKDLDRVHAVTVSSALAGKVTGLSFRQAEGRPGSSASIQIRNMGTPLYVIDGIQKDEGQFNNIAPNDIESITILKDASAAVYGVKAANGVVLVTTKTGKAGAKNVINVDAYTGWQNWTRWPKTADAYHWMLGKYEADYNESGTSSITTDELAKWQKGTDPGYQSFNWKDFIIKKNAPQTSLNVSTSGGTDKVTYYLSATNLNQSSVLGRQFTFARSNFQSNIDAQVTSRLKVGMHLNGRVETDNHPGLPGADDYWLPRFALFRNTPMEHPYANDNPLYLNNLQGHGDTNWALLNFDKSGRYTSNWRVFQSNFSAEYTTPLKGLVLRGNYSKYVADRVLDNQEYTYDLYTYYPTTDTYARTGGSTNPWREREHRKVLEDVYQGQADYKNTFGKHNVGAMLAVERAKRTSLRDWVHSAPSTDALSLIQFNDIKEYVDEQINYASVGYIGRLNYNFADKYYFEVSGRRDGSSKFEASKRWGFFPAASAGWRITKEGFMQSWLGTSNLLSDLKIRSSYGEMGDDSTIGENAFTYIPGYNYASSTFVNDGTVVVGAVDRGKPTNNLSWMISRITDVGLDYTMFDGKVTGAVDYFYRKRTGIPDLRYDVVLPKEVGYDPPKENANVDAQYGTEFSLAYTGKAGQLNYTVGGNLSISRYKYLQTYKPRFASQLNRYFNSGRTVDGVFVADSRYGDIIWGKECIGQFQSQSQINNYPVDIDGQGNKTLLPGDLIYKDQNGDGVINDQDNRPIGYPGGKNPITNFGFNISLSWKGFDMNADFSGGANYSYNRSWEMRWPYQNGGALLKDISDSHWHRENPADVNSAWIPGKYPAMRFNNGGHSNYNTNSTFWLTNVRYLRARTIELGYSLPRNVLAKVHMQKIRLYVNTYNLFTIDNLKSVGIDPEIMDENGLQYPQSRLVNVGANLTF
jgi:TonB-linked outer membrane protein, SusC/RagA family